MHTSATSATRAHCSASCTSVRTGTPISGGFRRRSARASADPRDARRGLVERGLVDEADPILPAISLSAAIRMRDRGSRARTDPRSSTATRSNAHGTTATIDMGSHMARTCAGAEGSTEARLPATYVHEHNGLQASDSQGLRDRARAAIAKRQERRSVRVKHDHVAFVPWRKMLPTRSSSASARAPPNVLRKNASTASNSDGCGAAPPCELRPSWQGARNSCRRLMHPFPGRHARDGVDHAQRAAETGHCRGTGSRWDNARARCRLAVRQRSNSNSSRMHAHARAPRADQSGHNERRCRDNRAVAGTAFITHAISSCCSAI